MFSLKLAQLLRDYVKIEFGHIRMVTSARVATPRVIGRHFFLGFRSITASWLISGMGSFFISLVGSCKVGASVPVGVFFSHYHLLPAPLVKRDNRGAQLTTSRNYAIVVFFLLPFHFTSRSLAGFSRAKKKDRH